MKFSEIYEFNQTNKHLIVEGSFNEEYSFGQEWDDVPFEDIENISFRTYDTFIGKRNKVEPRVGRYPNHVIEQLVEELQDFVLSPNKSGLYEMFSKEFLVFEKDLPKNPTWKDIFNTLDELIDESGDHHHIFPETIQKVGNSLRVELGS